MGIDGEIIELRNDYYGQYYSSDRPAVRCRRHLYATNYWAVEP